MILTQAELESLVKLVHRSPHTLLGMHSLGDGNGLVARAMIPGASEVRVKPVHDKSKPEILLKKIHSCGLFEGVTKAAGKVFAYDLVITDEQGNVQITRDPYSFLPSISDSELYLFGQGNERRLFDKLGAQFREFDGVPGISFAVWAPNARRVSVVGDFNNWNGRQHCMRLLGASGVWEIFIPGIKEGALYKFEILDAHSQMRLKTDPFAVFHEQAPKCAGIVWNTHRFQWTDDAWMKKRAEGGMLRKPMSIYEVHIGSWRKKGLGESFGYREVAQPLVEYVQQQGFTHVEFLPVSEHAYYPSWGYQVTGFYAPTSRYGTPDDFQYLINELHRAGIGVLVDWVPAHFPKDDFALARFDGTALYEHEDPRKGEHQDWGTLIFNYGRHEVRNFLTANALFWCERYHVDGLRVDAVASMLYLDYSRKEGEWIPNKYGGRENIEAIDFLRTFNHLVQTEHPGVLTIAEESTAWPLVSRPPYLGGLGFTFKWNMGWMHDTLRYFGREPIYRKYHQNDLTFAMLYHHNENFMLPLSHDEVVHGKRSLIGRMPGDDWQAFANMRTLFAYQWTFPGKKLLFMGGEIGQRHEWNPDAQLNWELLDQGPYHAGLQAFIRDLNHLYSSEPAFWEADYDNEGFYWIDCSDHESSVLSYVRQTKNGERKVVVILNLTPVVRCHYRVGLPCGGFWKELINSDAGAYGGGNQGNQGGVQAEDYHTHHQPFSAEFTLPPLSAIILRSGG